MTIKHRLAKLEEANTARMRQKAKYSSDNPRERYLALLNDNPYFPNTRDIPKPSLSPKEAYLAMIGEAGNAS